MDIPTNQISRHLSTIDIILSVIDNYGDIGFACELMATWQREIENDTRFVIWTNRVDEVTCFVDKNRHILDNIEIRDRADFGKDRLSLLAFALFHADIPEVDCFAKNSLVLRIDYLSFDPTWVAHHLDEHISSTENRQIIEIVPSPLPEGGGLIYPYDTTISRQSLAREYGLDIDKSWVIVFVYSDTLDTIIHFDHIDNHHQVLLFAPETNYEQENIIEMPWVDITTWHALVDESIWTIVRGEVSAVASIMRDKLAFWDMYKMIGGFNFEQSEDYLMFIGANEVYNDIHDRLNGVKKGGILFSELDAYIQKYGIPKIQNRERTKNLLTEIKKCIDSHEFSI